REVVHGVLQRHGVGRIIVSSLVGHSLDALRSGLPTLEVLHDFYPAWPLLGVHPQAWLETDARQPLQQALQHHELLPDFRDHDAAGWTRLAQNWRATVVKHGIKLVAPSQSVAVLLRQLDQGWNSVHIDIVHHGLVPLPLAGTVVPRIREDGKLRLVIPGRMQEGKGQSLLLEALPQLTRYAHITLLGAGKNGEAFFGTAGVNVVMQYRREELPGLMQAIGPDLAVLLSVVPETFSYTLSEMRQLGVPTVATRVGSFEERIQHGQDGWLIEPEVPALAEMVCRIAGQRKMLDTVRSNLARVDHQSATTMVQRYAEICPARLSTPRLSRPANLMDLQCSALAQQNAELENERTDLQRQAQELQREVEQRTEWARERDHALNEEQVRRKRWVKSLQAEIQSAQAALATQQTQLDLLDQVLESSSWRITRPLRAARRMLENLAQARAWNPRRWPLLISQAGRTVRISGWRGALLRFQQSPQRSRAPSTVFSSDIEPVGDPAPPPAMPRSATPEVSIVIPVFNQWLYTAACLRSIARANNRAGYEVVVVDDHSRDETADRLQDVSGLTNIRNSKNLGFIGSCNHGAEHARGRYILLLNNDTQVLDGWLDALLDTFKRFPDTGLAGARLVYPDGNLQEAGGLVFNDGGGWNYGRGDNPNKPEYAFTREVDYCSGACVIVPADLFRRLGCLDANYTPAYYEDTDLAFKVRQAGFKVRLQAAATVIHHEGVSSGTDLRSGTKHYQEIN
ncbi:MAG: glycosyltransferase, partial [Lysobacterales bacterium]